MNREDILKARANYKRRQKEKSELISLKKELSKLENDPKVKRYLQILSVKDRRIPSEEEMIRYSFSDITKDENDFKVYLYMGAFNHSWNYDEHDSQIFNKSNADYLLYLNIGDEWDSVTIEPNMQEEFEKQNIVLKPKSTLDSQNKYYELQTIYYQYLLKDSIISKNKILEKIKTHL